MAMRDLERITSSKQIPIPSCEQGKLCEEVNTLKDRIGVLELQVASGKADIVLEKYNTAIFRKSYDQSLKREIAARADYFQARDSLLATTKQRDVYRRAFNVMRTINIIFTVGFAVMTAILIWR